MHVGAAEFFGRDHLAGRRLHQRRAAEKDRALIAHDDALVRHRRHIGAAGGAGAHHDRDLRNARRRHLRLIVEDAAEMPFVGKNLVLLRQERAAGIDHVDAGQIVLPRDILGAQMLLHRHRIIGAALDGGIVGDDDAFAPRNPPDAGDDARRMHVAAIEAVGGQRRQFEKRGAGIDQEIDALARQHLAARGVPVARGLAAAAGDLFELLPEFRDQRPHGLGVAGKIGRGGIDAGMKRHGLQRFMVRRNYAQLGLGVMVSLRRRLRQPELSVRVSGMPGNAWAIPALNGSRARRAGTQNCRHRRPAGGPAPSARSPDRECPRARNRPPPLPWCRSECVSCCFMSPEEVQPINGSIARGCSGS